MSILHLLPSTPALRVRAENANHHLWNNHGTWFLHYTVHPTPFTKERIRRSLGTKDLSIARERRDAFFVHLGVEATGSADERRSRDAARPGQFFSGARPKETAA